MTTDTSNEQFHAQVKSDRADYWYKLFWETVTGCKPRDQSDFGCAGNPEPTFEQSDYVRTMEFDLR